MILIAYDGSDDADAAIERAGKVLPGAETVVLIVWERIVDVLTRTGSAFALGDLDYEAVDRSAEEHAREQAEAGVRRAEQAGLKARAHVQAREMSIAGSILAAGDELDADVILMGTRGLGRLKSVLLGSVSSAVLQQADRPVMVVPSPEVAAERRARHQQS